MGRRPIIVASIIAVVCIAGAGALYLRLNRTPSFDESFSDSCLKSAREITDAKGIPWQEVEATHRRMCTCSLDLFKALPEADQQALQTSEERRKAFAEEIQRRCQ